MSAPSASVNVNNGSPLFATIQPVQASGANSNGIVSNLAATLSDTSVAAATVKTSASGVSYIDFTTIKVGTVTVTVTATVTDTDGTVSNLTVVASVVVIPGANDTLTTSINILFSSVVPA